MDAIAIYRIYNDCYMLVCARKTFSSGLIDTTWSTFLKCYLGSRARLDIPGTGPWQCVGLTFISSTPTRIHPQKSSPLGYPTWRTPPPRFQLIYDVVWFFYVYICRASHVPCALTTLSTAQFLRHAGHFARLYFWIIHASCAVNNNEQGNRSQM